MSTQLKAPLDDRLRELITHVDALPKVMKMSGLTAAESAKIRARCDALIAALQQHTEG